MLRPLRLIVDELESGSPAIVDLAMLKRHVRIDTVDDDALLDRYLQAAVRWAENTTHRAIVSRAHAWVLAAFNDDPNCSIRLPRGITRSVESVDYSSGGAMVSLFGPSADASPAGADYQEDLRSDAGGILMPLRGTAWPVADDDVPAPVTINFTAGYAADDIPADIGHALMFFVADCYDLRGTPDFNPAMLGTAGVRFEAREALISPWRLPRIY